MKNKNILSKGILFVSGIACIILYTEVNAAALMSASLLACALGAGLYKLPVTAERIKRSFRAQNVTAAALIAFLTAIPFYRRWIFSGSLDAVVNVTGIGKGLIVTVMAVSIGLMSLPLLCMGIELIIETLYKREKFRPELPASVALLVLFIILLIALIPLIRADFNYIDDMGRAFEGYDEWSYFSRHSSNFMSHIVHAGDYLADVSPLTQLLALVITATAGLIILSVVKGKKTFSVFDVISVIPLALCPYFLECLSYKYDSTYMALSVLVTVAPLLAKDKHIAVYALSVLCGTLVMLMSYQAASGIFPMLVVLLALIMWSRKEDMKKTGIFVGVSAGAYLVGLAVYFLFIMKPVEDYVENSVASVSDIIGHYREFTGYLVTDFRLDWLIVILVLSLWFVIASVCETKRNRFISAVVSIFAVGLMFLLSFGLYPALSVPTYFPRSMFGVGAFIVCMTVGNPAGKKADWLTGVLSLILAWFFFAFACSYGNALSAQKDYTDLRTQEIVEDLIELDEYIEAEDRAIKLIGSVGYSPVIDNMPDNYNILRRLVPVQLREDWWWGSYELMNYYGLDAGYDEEIDFDGSFELLHKSLYHEIYGRENAFVIILK